MDDRIEDALAAGRGAVRRADHPPLEHAFDEAVKRRHLVAPFRGVYVSARHAETLGVRAQALAAADPDAVIHGPAAAHLVGWPGVGDPGVVTASSLRVGPRDGFRIDRRRVPRELTRRWEGLRLTSRALTALDLVGVLGPQALDDALRLGVRLDQLHDAVARLPHRPGNRHLRDLLRDSRDRPWSEAERVAHRSLRRNGVRGWVANHAVCLDRDSDAVVDIAFRWLRLAVEVDGYAHHGTRQAFVRDRLRDVRLAAVGWHVVRFAASAVLSDPDGFAARVRGLVAMRRRQLTG